MLPQVSLLIIAFQVPIILGALLRSGIAFCKEIKYELRGMLKCIEKHLVHFDELFIIDCND